MPRAMGGKMIETMKEWTPSKQNFPKETGQNDGRWILSDKWKYGFLKNEGIL